MINERGVKEDLGAVRLRIVGEGIISLDPNNTGLVNTYMARTFLRDLFNKYKAVYQPEMGSVEQLLPNPPDTPVQDLKAICFEFLGRLQAQDDAWFAAMEEGGTL
jgi:hypothetical protein